MRGSPSPRAQRRSRPRHRQASPYRPRHLRAGAGRRLRRSGVRRITITLLLISIATGALFVGFPKHLRQAAPSGNAYVAVSPLASVDRSNQEASRSLNRPTTHPTPSASRGPSQASSPQPIAGLTQTRMNNAATIVRIGKQLSLPTRACVVAIATALQESRLLNLANKWVPESLNLPHEGVGADHDSVGLFQQRPSTGWGSVAELMDPSTAARKFYLALARVPGWQRLSVAAAAQAVQVSAFPYAYAQQEPLAARIVTALG